MTANDTTLKEKEMAIKPITVIAASAGTGKTYRLSHEYLKGLAQTERKDAGIIATTFTNKAADELVERIRRVLLDQGKWLEAQSVLSGYLGTVNALCGRFLSEHAIDAGLSPDLTIIGEERLPAVFAIAVDSVVHDFADEMHGPALRLQLDNWRKSVMDVINHARDNNIDAGELEKFAEDSWATLQAQLEPCTGVDGDKLDSHLASTLDAVLQQLPGKDDFTQTTRAAVAKLGDLNIRVKSGAHLVWQSWADMSKLNIGKSSSEIVKPLYDAAQHFARHPRLHDDIRTVIFGVFRCAAAAMKTYADYKKEHGLIDFVDQMLLTLRLLEKPEVRKSLQSRTRLLLVDEFQDTSPIQLAIFLELAKLVEYSVWVGDEKQSIFGFRGSDPELMRNAIKLLVTTTGGTMDVLSTSYRSRPNLVAFTNALFSNCNQLDMITTTSSIIEEVDRNEHEEQNDALHVWWLKARKNEQALGCLAGGIADVLRNADKWKVLDRHTKQLRPIAGSDIAILCKTNEHRTQAAKALVAEGLTVATERNALLDTPECVLACAALRVVVDKTDTLAIAEIANLLNPGQDDWLNYVLKLEGKAWLKNWLSIETSEPVDAESPFAKTLLCLNHLKAIREDCVDRTPSEILEEAMNCDGILETITAWGNIRQRFANLDSLRGIARTYEELSRSSRTPATAAGLIVHLYKFVSNGGNQPANPDENGIHILTYHKSKGLEWPMVVLFDLDRSGMGSPFGVQVDTTTDAADPLKPLAGKTIRFWPWPFGRQKSKIKLSESVRRTTQGKIATKRAVSEDVRLLYVGMTRARDYLVFACRTTGYSTNWLKCLTDRQYELPLLTLSDEGVAYKKPLIDGEDVSMAQFTPLEEPSQRRDPAIISGDIYAPASFAREDWLKHAPYYLNPSTAGDIDFEIHSAKPPETIIIGERIPLRGEPDMLTVGDTVHAFLSIDPISGDNAARLALASDVVAGYATDHVDVDALPVMTDRLIKFLRERHPEAEIMNEMPVQGKLGSRRVRGTIDLLAKTSEGFIIIDHKTFPGRFEEWEARAVTHAPQLALYRHMVEQATGIPVIAQYIHMPVVGAMIKLDCKLIER